MSGRGRGRRAGLVGAAVGLVAVGVGAGLAAERLAVGRIRLKPDPDAREPFGQLEGRSRVVLADDGVPLHVEEVGPPEAPLTVIFSHGYALETACWHYQWLGLSEADGPGRLVFWDQRSHGRSGRSTKEHSTIEWCGDDLLRVIQEVAPTGPLVLVGHSMGGMTVMALAERHPELFADRVVGVALIATSPGRLSELTLGIPARVAKLVKPLTGKTVEQLGRRADLVERGRRVGSDLGFLLTKRYAFGGPVAPSLVEFVERMIAAVPIDVIADFYPTFDDHDKLEALHVLHGIETLILVGDEDLVTPRAHSEQMLESLPEAELVVIPGAGHLVQLERPSLVNLHLRALCARAARAAGLAA
jgi:pimeloyl-ACP methyl ester carboxylesterase